MKNSRRQKTGLILSTFVFLCFTAFAQPYADKIGLTLLQAAATNVNGAGIRVGQPEANLGGEPSQFEVNPANQNLPFSRFTYLSADGVATVYTNTVGLNSGHADVVAGVYYGVPGGVATNVAHVDNFAADFYITNYVYNLLPAQNDTVVNQSFSFGPLDATDQESVDSAYDNYEETFGTLLVSGVGNGTNASVTAPGTAYNCIGVGAYATPFNYSCVGPTIDNGRCKPDLTAINVADSFSTPQVAGSAADLMQAALRGDGGSDTNSAFNLRTIKALLLNGAVKPADWTNSSASPLDLRYGAGVVNVFNSYRQLTGGKHGPIVSQLISSGHAHPPTGATGAITAFYGWDFNTNTSSVSPAKDSVNHYYFDVSNNVPGATFTATATLVWNRHLNQNNINRLCLFLYDCANSNLVACSTSLVDNVGHLSLPRLAQGRYDLQVWKAGGPGIVSAAETYALAFEFFSETLTVTGSGTNVTLAWPGYPAGFEVQANTNLATTNWTTTALPSPVITNNMNTIQLNSTNAYQFFRLRRPNL